MSDTYSLVDPFLGNGAVDLPPAAGIAATWFWPKAQAGNTHPGACTPHGLMSVCPYSGAYITGYGKLGPNTHGHPPREYTEAVASGFTHLQQSGTGNIRKFYNYLRITPLPMGQDLAVVGQNWQLADEAAAPGWYRCRLPELDVAVDLSVSPRAARHRYQFPGQGGRLVLDAAVGGLLFDGFGSHPEAIRLQLVGQRSIQGWIIVEGVRIDLLAELLGPGQAVLWRDGAYIEGRHLDLDVLDPTDPQPCGACWEAETETMDLAVSIALGGPDRLVTNLSPARRPYEQVVKQAASSWRAHLDVVQLEGGDDRLRTVFASALYHSLVKPIDISDENPPWLHGAEAFIDVATLWDQYKTQLPLIQTLFPETGGRIARAFANTAETVGDMPCGLLLASDHTQFANQASCLAHQVWYGAWCRRLPGFDPERALRLMVASFHRGHGRKLLQADPMASPTHVLDLSQAAWCTARLAEALGHQRLVERFDHMASYAWRRVFDADGLMHAGTYYEGSRSTYSFRPFHAMDERIALSGGTDRFVQQLDHFFGFTRQAVQQPENDPSDEFMAAGLALGSFEGLNNEPDMETPYSYIFAGRPDRTAEVVRAICQYQFHTGPGGLPGNDDSGGLSSWFVWSAIGLFPITGTALVCIGSPHFEQVTMPWCGAELQIKAVGASDRPYVGGAKLNGQDLDRAWLRLDELAQGGVLELAMCAEPNDWGQHRTPQLRPISLQP